MNMADGRFEEAKENYATFLEIRPNEAYVQSRFNYAEKVVNESAAYIIEQEHNINGILAAEDKYQVLKNSNKYYFNENELNAFGYRLLQKRKTGDAIKVFRWNVELFPNSANVYDSLGEAYLKNNQIEIAIKNYQRSLELNPNNNNAKDMLEQIKK
jgi:tetratricopeptide (TPR) repeat protein